MKQCPECNEMVNDEIQECPNCGFPFENEIVENVETNTFHSDIIPLKTCSICGQIYDPTINETCPFCSEKVMEESFVKVNSNEKKKKYILIGALICACIAVVVFWGTSNMRIYNKATKLYENKEYEQAMLLFEKLGDYEDSLLKSKESTFRLAKEKYADGKYEESIELTGKIKGYKEANKITSDSQHMIDVGNDTEKPKINNLPDTITFEQDEKYDIQKWVNDNSIFVKDNVSSGLSLDYNDSAVDIHTPGEYKMTFSATDEAGNKVSKTIKVIVEKTQYSKEEIELLLLAWINSTELPGDNRVDYNPDSRVATINCTMSGIGEYVSMMKLGYISPNEEWNDMTNNIKTITSQLIALMERSGYKDIDVIFNLVNDANSDKILFSASNGIILYDVMG